MASPWLSSRAALHSMRCRFSSPHKVALLPLKYFIHTLCSDMLGNFPSPENSIHFNLRSSRPRSTSRPGYSTWVHMFHAHATAQFITTTFPPWINFSLPIMPYSRLALLVFITLSPWTSITVAASPPALKLANTTVPPQYSIECVISDAWVTRNFIAGDCFTALAILEDWEVSRYVT